MGIEGRDDTSNSVFIFDFDLAKLYIDPDTGAHIPYREGLYSVGTPRYSSYHAHHGRGTSNLLPYHLSAYICP